MSAEKCMKCGNAPDNGLPICTKCRMGFKDSIDPKSKQEINGFVKLAEFLNNFEGDMSNLVWLIKSEIADRQCLIMSQCNIDMNCRIEAPDGNHFAKRRSEEIDKLYNALSIVKKHYGG